MRHAGPVRTAPNGAQYRVWHVDFSASLPHWLLVLERGAWRLARAYATEQEADDELAARCGAPAEAKHEPSQ